MAKYRSQFQKDHDRARIASMVKEDHKQTEIAAELGLSPQLVSKEIKAMNEEWRFSHCGDVVDHKAREVERLNYLEGLLWECWDKSKEGKTTKQRWLLPGVTTEADPNPKPVPCRMSVTTENDPGDPRYMKAILDVAKQRCKLLGLYGPLPAKVMIEDDRPDPAKMTIEERKARALEMLRQFGGDVI